jgi:hypothetical protein
LRTDIEIINLPPKCRHVEGLGFSGLVESWWFPHTTNYKSESSSLHLWQTNSPTSHNELL